MSTESSGDPLSTLTTEPHPRAVSEAGHIPVLCSEVLNHLPKWEQFDAPLLVDGTVGAGGHTEAILKQAPEHLRVLAIDRDPFSLERAQQRLAPWGDRIQYHRGNFSELPTILSNLGIGLIHGAVLVDFGVASYHLDDGERGFSFRHPGPLDMRLGQGSENRPTAADLLNTWSARDLTDIFSRYGEERFSKTIANAIVNRRQKQPWQTTDELAQLIQGIYDTKKGQIRRKNQEAIHVASHHPATCVFQALRIAVNEELDHIERFLDGITPCLTSGSRLLCISFHSLEDRLVKQAFRRQAKEPTVPPHDPRYEGPAVLSVVNTKPITASDREIEGNPRARSAKLRVAERR